MWPFTADAPPPAPVPAVVTINMTLAEMLLQSTGDETRDSVRLVVFTVGAFLAAFLARTVLHVGTSAALRFVRLLPYLIVFRVFEGYIFTLLRVARPSFAALAYTGNGFTILFDLVNRATEALAGAIAGSSGGAATT